MSLELARPNTPPKTPVKPKLRGVSHELACYVSAAAGAYLVSKARGPGQSHDALVGATIYSLCLFFMFAASALYHRPTWTPEARQRMRRLDHSTIYLLIAGTSTPIAMIALDGSMRTGMLLTLWIGATLGILKSLLWIRAPKALSALVYVLIGASAVPFMPRIASAIGPEATQLILYGAGLYVLGAAVYAFRRPDPVPHVFGYHEIFHTLVIAAAICQYAAIFKIVRMVSGAGV